MGKNIFVSYKYADRNVEHLDGCWPTTARDYVNLLSEKIEDKENFYYGEDDGEDLSGLSEDAIYEHLKDKIYPTSITIVLLSPNMREIWKSDRDQWIPWEIYYSLRETERNDRTSHRNGILAVALPDSNGSYDYVVSNENCCSSGCRMINSSFLFKILKENRFNLKNDDGRICQTGSTIYSGDHSYIPIVKWKDFVVDMDTWIRKAEYLKNHCDDYELTISVD